jgi:hypothetical protein
VEFDIDVIIFLLQLIQIIAWVQRTVLLPFCLGPSVYFSPLSLLTLDTSLLVIPSITSQAAAVELICGEQGVFQTNGPKYLRL